MAEYYPVKLRQAGEFELEISWSDGHESVYPVRVLRLNCPCALCVHELSGRKILDEAAVSADVKPMVINPEGRYAINIHWTDGHKTGIYTYELLRSLCPCSECRASRESKD
ncbi:MAG: DUF971 domain-containing protein [Planctomycetes bacterium]|nr:DUF971 domain-containing protein [Planctomycetota bacterium]